MLKKFAIALMAVMVFAIPVSASAETSYVPKSNYDEVIYFNKDGDLYRYSYWVIGEGIGSNYVSYYVEGDGVYFQKKEQVPTSYGYSYERVNSDGTFTEIYRDGSTMSQWGIKVEIPSKSSFVYTSSSIKVGSADSAETFTVTPPTPVKLEAVKTVQEIVPQAGAVAGGIVLVASILLGLWLVIGLVRRLVFSYLR